MASSGGFRIQLERSGGLAGLGVRTAVDSSRLPEPERERIASLLDQVGQEGLGRVGEPAPGADRFQYDLTIDRDGRREQIRAHDGSLTPALQELTRRLLAIARGRGDGAGEGPS